MSRSIKKNPICKSGNNSRYGKRLANKKVRRTLIDMPQKSKAYKKVYESYNITDYVCRWTFRDALEDYYYGNRKEYWQSHYTEEEFIKYWTKSCRRK